MKDHWFYVHIGKRFIDIFLSLIAVILLLPVYLIMIVLELIFHGSPPTYNTKRAGKDCKPFLLFKFRSMTNEKDENGVLLPNERRLTRFGRVIRRASLDEIPEFINILKGDMSFIGPRPMPMEYIPLYSAYHLKKQQVKPGLACPRLAFSDSYPTWDEQFDNEAWYAENVSFSVDVRMTVALVKTVFNRKKSQIRGEAKRGKFTGSQSK